jgi:hypothetical protein
MTLLQKIFSHKRVFRSGERRSLRNAPFRPCREYPELPNDGRLFKGHPVLLY